MRIPLEWLQNYIKLQHTPEEFGNIMTKLEFMQDGPIDELNGYHVIDLEVRQNRPDIFSIIGVAREYAAYIGEKVELPEESHLPEGVEWGSPEKNLAVEATDIVKRFCTVEITGVSVKPSPKWLKENLEAYGIPSINNLVDITNYVMLEYGMPMHAFDFKKLKKEKGKPTLTLRRAKINEHFVTWQNTKIELTKNDLVVADAEKPVAIAGIIGGANSDIGTKTKDILLESACYNHASVRRSSQRHTLRTEASSRHEEFLNPEMVSVAMRRALWLIHELCGGTVVRVEDYYEPKVKPKIIEFDLYEVSRLSGVQLENEEIERLLERLGFEILERRDAVGVGKNLVSVRVPMWRTDIEYEADLVEEVMRLWGYDNIPERKLDVAPPDHGTPQILQLEEKIRDIFTHLGLYEYITNPIVTFSNQSKQIKLENPLNADANALRTSIRATLEPVAVHSQKAKVFSRGIFEVGKVYTEEKKALYKEERRVETLYWNTPFEKIKGDLHALLIQLDIYSKLRTKASKTVLSYHSEKAHAADLFQDGYILFPEACVDLVELLSIPHFTLQTTLNQRIEEHMNFVLEKKQSVGEIVSLLQNANGLISSVQITDGYVGKKFGDDKKSITFTITFEDPSNQMTKDLIEQIKGEIVKKMEKMGVTLRK